MTTTITQTKDKLQAMLTENTGEHFLDSGGAYGRAWQRNQGIDFDACPPSRVEFEVYHGDDLYINVTHSVYHWLEDRVEYNEELDTKYREFVEKRDLYLDIQSATMFVETLPDVGGIYGEGDAMTVNTYNGEDLLSQTLQFVYWEDEDGEHVMLQIHGGCDVRGGYTDPVAFDLNGMSELAMFDNARATLFCNGCNHYWDTDDGCNWYSEGSCGRGYTNLEDYDVVEEKPEYPEIYSSSQKLIPGIPKRPEFSSGKLWVDEDKNGHCPYCGTILEVSAV